jgi:hypothetical protein
MGQEIATTRFREEDFARFKARCGRELALLRELEARGALSARGAVAGVELEAWLVDNAGEPRAINGAFLGRMADPDVVHELAKFNVELNVAAQPIAGQGLPRLEAALERTWRACLNTAAGLDATLIAIGILPTLRDSMLCPDNMSDAKRYKALNEQVLRQREGRPIRLDIVGREHLSSEHRDMMLEAAATSFQIHLQVPAAHAVRYYNAALVASAATVAVAANSPLLFGRLLWEETRIPVFEQSMGVESARRVGFGSGYARESILELFAENGEFYAPLLPLELDEPQAALAHLRLHNGTIWRWNRPLIGFDGDGRAHLRIEHRPLPAGPTIADMAANMAFFYGLAESLAREPEPPEQALPFAAAKHNFYEAARLGLAASVDWIDGRRWALARLLLGELIPRARAGLGALAVDAAEINRYLGIIEARVASGQTGAAWQRAFLERHGTDFGALVRVYRELSHAGAPVHTWDL